MASPLLRATLITTLSRDPSTLPPTPQISQLPNPTPKIVTFQLPERYQPVETYIADELDCDVVNITIGTGDLQKSFNVHKTPLCKKIPYFDKMFNGSFEEASTQRATFPEDHLVPFMLLIGWVYTKTIEIPKSLECDGSEEDPAPHPTTHLLRLFVLAEKLMVPKLADATIDLLSKYCAASCILPHIEYLNEEYKETPEDSKLRLWIARAIAHQFCFSVSESYESEPLKVLLADDVYLLGDFLSALKVQQSNRDGSEPSDPTDFPPCDYHQHAESEPCPYAQEK
ncbi:uncharacterized protein PAC_16663 [Phialocephala subalpina]|uniref:BTB domain-containing protein n=1 Tax=Phialocephala subalpina TaxID=576137 RepID=A0A1L7XP14_9HELO|nr:uncharacterized protein PAC_16663 [Phialocephala subalpina]